MYKLYANEYDAIADAIDAIYYKSYTTIIRKLNFPYYISKMPIEKRAHCIFKKKTIIYICSQTLRAVKNCKQLWNIQITLKNLNFFKQNALLSFKRCQLKNLLRTRQGRKRSWLHGRPGDQMHTLNQPGHLLRLMKQKHYSCSTCS